MDLLETIKGAGYLAREYHAKNFKVNDEMSVTLNPCSRRRIDYVVVSENGDKFWKEKSRYEFVHRETFSSGKWEECKDGWMHSDEELIRMTRMPNDTNINK